MPSTPPKERSSALVVGIDPILELIPACFFETKASTAGLVAGIENFCTTVIDIAHTHVTWVKPQVAFFERFGALGWACFERVCSYAHAQGLKVIADCKRGDIGTTAEGYAAYYFPKKDDPYPSSLTIDALTVNPFMGLDTLKPFLERAHASHKQLFVLLRTSNPGAAFIQEYPQQEPCYLMMAKAMYELGQHYRQTNHSTLGFVVGATVPEQARRIRNACPDSLFLVPGLGAQGGAPELLGACLDAKGGGALINASRSILFAYRNSFAGEDWKAAKETLSLTEFKATTTTAIKTHVAIVDRLRKP